MHVLYMTEIPLLEKQTVISFLNKYFNTISEFQENIKHHYGTDSS